MKAATLALIGATSLVTGCAYGASGVNGLDAYRGNQVSEVFDAIGFPDRQEVIAGQTVYFWGTDQPGRGPSCTVKIVASPTGQVQSWNAYGNATGCDRYAGPLKRRLKSRARG